MKRFLFMLLLLTVSFSLYAVDLSPLEETSFIVELGTFTGLIAVVSFFVTQMAKLIPAIGNHRWAKILVSIVVGILVCIFTWLTKQTPFLIGLDAWQVILYGAGAGLSGCGFYDIVKPILELVDSDKDDLDWKE